VQLCNAHESGDRLVQAGGDDGGENRADQPRSDQCQQRIGVGERAREQVPADDPADDRLGGRDRQPGPGHHEYRGRRRQRDHESAGYGVDRPQFSERERRTGAADHRSKDNERAADDRGGAESHHARAHGGTENVGGIVGPERPAEKQPAR
jgi:hypothetical protein